MALNFPASPNENDTHTEGSITYKWDGSKWIGLGLTPSDRLVDGSNNLEINSSNNLIWTGGSVGIGINNPARILHLHESSSDTCQLHITNSTTGTSGSDGVSFALGSDESLIINQRENNDIVLKTDDTDRLRIKSDGEVHATGGVLKLGTADTSSAHLNSFEVMTFNIDTDNDDTNRYFSFYKDGASGSGTELLRLSENGVLNIVPNTNGTGLLAYGDPTGNSFRDQNRIGGTTVVVADESISSAIFMPRDGAMVVITAFSEGNDNDGNYPQPNTSGMAYVDCGPSRNIQILDLGTAVGTDIVGKGTYTANVSDCDNNKLTVMAGNTEGTFRLVNRSDNNQYRYQITFL